MASFVDSIEIVERCETCDLATTPNDEIELCCCWTIALSCGCRVNLLDEESVCWCGNDSQIPALWQVKQDRESAKQAKKRSKKTSKAN